MCVLDFTSSTQDVFDSTIKAKVLMLTTVFRFLLHFPSQLCLMLLTSLMNGFLKLLTVPDLDDFDEVGSSVGSSANNAASNTGNGELSKSGSREIGLETDFSFSMFLPFVFPSIPLTSLYSFCVWKQHYVQFNPIFEQVFYFWR